MIDPDTAAIILYFQQLITILALGLVAIGTVAVMSFLFAGILAKRINRLEAVLAPLTETLKAVDAQNIDTHTPTPKHGTETAPEPPKLDGGRP